MGTRGGNPSKGGMYECQMREMYSLYTGVLNLKMYALWGVQLTRANGYINFSKCMQAWGFCTSIQLISFFLGYLLKPVKTRRSPGNTWGHLKTNTCKHDETRIAPRT